MSEFPPIDDLIGALMEDANSNIRAEAARLIGEMSHTLNGEDREFAKQALNRAMTDPDPMVLMSVMTAIGKFPAQAVEEHDNDEPEDDSVPIKADACAVCGRPVALVDADTCQYDNCPYQS